MEVTYEKDAPDPSWRRDQPRRTPVEELRYQVFGEDLPVDPDAGEKLYRMAYPPWWKRWFGLGLGARHDHTFFPEKTSLVLLAILPTELPTEQRQYDQTKEKARAIN
jgi:hypothetical protein